jgi:hypothetical protein
VPEASALRRRVGGTTVLSIFATKGKVLAASSGRIPVMSALVAGIHVFNVLILRKSYAKKSIAGPPSAKTRFALLKQLSAQAPREI